MQWLARFYKVAAFWGRSEQSGPERFALESVAFYAQDPGVLGRIEQYLGDTPDAQKTWQGLTDHLVRHCGDGKDVSDLGLRMRQKSVNISLR